MNKDGGFKRINSQHLECPAFNGCFVVATTFRDGSFVSASPTDTYLCLYEMRFGVEHQNVADAVAVHQNMGKRNQSLRR